MSTAATRAIHVRIAGRVQGVGCRAWAKDEADALALSGWVRNTDAGDVEAVFSGPAESVEAMLALCREGPRHARVDSVTILGEVAPAAGPFAIRR